jgi:hypothetical protein
MTQALRAVFLSTVVFGSAAGLGASAFAQQAIIPAPNPNPGPAPSAPADVQKTYDEVSIGQLMKLVELSRLIGGGISQLYSAAETQRQALESMREAQIGRKSIPLNNGQEEIEDREGGPGIKEMVDGALNGAPLGPQALRDALTEFRTEFSLDKAFALKDDELPGKKMIARASAQGAIASSLAEQSYKRTNASMGRLDGYLLALENSADLKTSVDINTRVMIEIAQQLNESVRTQSAIASVAGAYFMILGGESGQEDFLDGLVNFNR